MLKLKTPEIGIRDLAIDITGLLPRETKFYVKFSYRAGGNGNPAFVAGLERLRHSDMVAARVADRMDSDEAHATAALSYAGDRGRKWFGMLYDTCIVSWETNILSDEKPIEPTRENFIAMAETVWPTSLVQAMVTLQSAIMKAGADAAKVDTDTVKN